MSAPIRVINESFQLLAEIEDYESLQLARRWYKPGEFELKINLNKGNVDTLAKDNIIFLGTRYDTGCIIMHREIELDEGGKESETLTIRGPTLAGYTGRRITIPPSGYDTESYTSIDAETVMRSMVSNHLVSPTDTARQIAFLALATNLNRGASISWDSRYKVLVDELEAISLASGLGWGFDLDFTAMKAVFTVRQGLDRTYGNGVNPQALFSPDFDNLREQQLNDSNYNLATWALVAGQGEGAARATASAGSGTGASRYELFVDARDISDSADLSARGAQKLLEMPGQLTLEGKVVPVSNLVYREDYDLGDLVTIQNRAWGVTLNTRITEAIETYQVDGFELELAFGSNVPTLSQVIRRQSTGGAGSYI